MESKQFLYSLNVKIRYFGMHNLSLVPAVR